VSQLLLGGGEVTAGVAGVGGAHRLDEQHPGFAVGARAVLDAPGNDEEITCGQLDVAVPQLDRQASLDDQEEIIGVRVRVSDELTTSLDHLELVVVETADDSRCEVPADLVERRSEIDCLVHVVLPVLAELAA